MALRWDRRRFAPTDIMATLLTRARPTATMGLTGSRVASLSVRVRGFMAQGGWEAGAGLMVGMVVRGTDIRAGAAPGMAAGVGAMDVATMDAVLPAPDFMARPRSAAALVSTAEVSTVPVGSTAAGSTVEVAFTAADSMVAEASTAVVVMAADAANR